MAKVEDKGSDSFSSNSDYTTRMFSVIENVADSQSSIFRKLSAIEDLENKVFQIYDKVFGVTLDEDGDHFSFRDFLVKNSEVHSRILSSFNKEIHQWKNDCMVHFGQLKEENKSLRKEIFDLKQFFLDEIRTAPKDSSSGLSQVDQKMSEQNVFLKGEISELKKCFSSFQDEIRAASINSLSGPSKVNNEKSVGFNFENIITAKVSEKNNLESVSTPVMNSNVESEVTEDGNTFSYSEMESKFPALGSVEGSTKNNVQKKLQMDLDSPVKKMGSVDKSHSVGWSLAVGNYIPQTKRQFQYNSMVSTSSLILSGDHIESFIQEREDKVSANDHEGILDMLGKFLPVVHLGFNLEKENIKGTSFNDGKCIVCFDSQQTAQKILTNKRFLQNHKIFVLPFLNKDECFFQSKIVDEFRKFRSKLDGQESFNFSVYKKGYFLKIVDHQRHKKLFYGCDSHLSPEEFLVSNGIVVNRQ